MAISDQLVDKGLPANLLAERTVLGAILLDSFHFFNVADLLQPDDFHLDAHRKIYRAMRELAQSSTAIDFITLGEALERTHDLESVGSHVYLTTLTEGLPRGLNVEHYAHIIKNRAMERDLLSVGQGMVQAVLGGQLGSEVLDEAQRRIFEISSARVQGGLTSVADLAGGILDTLDALHGQEISGLRTGFADFDELTTGLQKSDLIIVAGRPSMGKTSFVMNIVENAALDHGKTAAVFSLEMSNVQLVLRMLCSLSQVDGRRLRQGHLGRHDIELLTQAAGRLAQAGIYIDDSSGIDMATVRAKCRRLQAELAAQHPPRTLDLVAVDYLQLMGSSGRSENRNLEVSAISRGMKILAKELNCPVIVLSQLSRAPEQRTGNHEPILSDLRESGSIEQDADVVAFIYRDEVYTKANSQEPGVARIIVAKQRNGPIGTIKLAFLNHCTKFVNKAPDDGYEP
ncbi:MAG TPA: replicative DNA helicase [Terriglobales bacterium]|jgi:replicative DNA helicase